MTTPVTTTNGVRVDAASVAQAKRYLDGRMRQRFDNRRVNWTVTDANMLRRLLSYVRELEAR